MSLTALKTYQYDFVKFLISAGALTFGDFVTKSGRQTPYFVNTGNFDSGRKIAELGRFYAEHIKAMGLIDVDIIFGPAYKGISLAVTVASKIYELFGQEVGFAFDRKEKKDHGDKGQFVGREPKAGDRVLIVEDVITAGTTFKEIVPMLRDRAVTVVGGVIAVDRSERGQGTVSALKEIEAELKLRICPIVTINDILSCLDTGIVGLNIDSSLRTRILEYISKYVVTE